MAAVAEHADRQRMAFLDDALAVEGGEQRQLEALDETAHLRPRAAPDRAEADQRHDLLVPGEGVGEIVGDLGDPRRIGQDRLHHKAQVAIIVHLDAVVREVLRHVDVHRAGPALEGQVHRLLHDIHRLGDIGQQPALLGGCREHRLRIRRPVDARRLVERALAAPVERRIARDGEQRIGIRHRHRKAGEKIEGARPRGRPADAELVGEHRVAAGGEGGTLLVAGDDRADLRRMLQRDHHAGGILAGAAEGRVHADTFQPANNRLVDAHGPTPASCPVTPGRSTA